jgi:FKBP-type peptidyl-prolyl cis-trans isomerase 2
MKTICMRKMKTFIQGLALSSIVAFSLNSCLKDDTDELIAEHNIAFEAMKSTYGITEADLIGDGIYVHFTSTTDTGEMSVRAVMNNYVVVDLEGYDSNGDIFDVTSDSVAAREGVHREDLVYGPIMININNTFSGFYKAIQQVPEGWSTNMLFPYDQAFGGYEPIAYKVKLYRVIRNYDSYMTQSFQYYKELLGLTEEDTIAGLNGVYVKTTIPSDTVPDLYPGDKIQIELHGYYVESDTAYVDGFPGRCFFPINNSGDTIEFIKGELLFPVTSIVDEMVDRMNIGQEIEVITPATYGYGAEGFVHPFTGAYIIPPNMPLHYKLRLLGVTD